MATDLPVLEQQILRSVSLKVRARIRKAAEALFAVAGQQEWPVHDRAIGGVQACRQAGITAARRPTRRQVRIVPAPKNSPRL